jgi:hypothetical protein
MGIAAFAYAIVNRNMDTRAAGCFNLFRNTGTSVGVAGTKTPPSPGAPAAASRQGSRIGIHEDGKKMKNVHSGQAPDQ